MASDDEKSTSSSSSSSTSPSSSGGNDGNDSSSSLHLQTMASSGGDEPDAPTTSTAAEEIDDDERPYDRNDYGDYGAEERDEREGRRAFVSRVPQSFGVDSLVRSFEKAFGEGCVAPGIPTEDDRGESDEWMVQLVYEREDDGDAEGDKRNGDNGDGRDRSKRGARGEAGAAETKKPHRGFAFVTFASDAQYAAAIEAGTVRGRVKPDSKRRHTLYLRPAEPSSRDGGGGAAAAPTGGEGACFLWSKFRCPYGDGCKFAHAGEGGCVEDARMGGKTMEKKKQKCFAFKKKGKCKLGADCPFSHDVTPVAGGDENTKGAAKNEGNDGAAKEGKKGGSSADGARDKSQKDCFDWKTKGKCRKNDRGKCPYRHLESAREKALAKKKKRGGGPEDEKNDENKDGTGEKNRQPLCVRVFGLPYDCTPDDVRFLFAKCGPIVDLSFPTFEDSGRSKGYCGLVFQSPKAVAKALELNGTDMGGRWLSVQEGKMFLKKWEENHKRVREGDGEGGEGEHADGDDGRKGGDRRPEQSAVGEFGQKVKKRKKHGYTE